MDIYIVDAAGGAQLRLPVMPSEIALKRDKNTETVSLLNLGEADVPKAGTKLDEISFSSFFPAAYDSSYCNYSPLPAPNEAMAQLDVWADAETPVRLIITDLNINKLMLLSAQTLAVQGGEPGDIYYDLTFRAYKEVRVRTAPSAQAAPARPDLRPAVKIYVVKEGDTLTGIARAQLGSSARWTEIYAIPENKAKIGPDPGALQIGITLVIP